MYMYYVSSMSCMYCTSTSMYVYVCTVCMCVVHTGTYRYIIIHVHVCMYVLVHVELSGCMDTTVGTGMFMVRSTRVQVAHVCIKAILELHVEANFLSIFLIFLIYKS